MAMRTKISLAVVVALGVMFGVACNSGGSSSGTSSGGSCPGQASCGNGYCCDYSHPYYCGGSCYSSTPTTSTCSSSTYITCN